MRDNAPASTASVSTTSGESGPVRYMDELDAVTEGSAWLEQLARQFEADTFTCRETQGGGGLHAAWSKGRLLGYFVLLRDDWNATLLVCHDLTPFLLCAPTPSDEKGS